MNLLLKKNSSTTLPGSGKFSKKAFAFADAASSISEDFVNSGAIAAICIARSFAAFTKSAFCATKSVSQFN